jgi:hypothetical protein
LSVEFDDSIDRFIIIAVDVFSLLLLKTSIAEEEEDEDLR